MGDERKLALRRKVAALLPLLPSLTRLVLTVFQSDGLQHLRSLPNLRSLDLRFDVNPGEHVERAVAHHVRNCHGLQELALGVDFEERHCFPLSSALVDFCLDGLTQLHTLYLTRIAVGSLSFLAQLATLPHSLTSLALDTIQPRLLPAELVHLHGLKVLESLELVRVFTQPLSFEAMAQLTPPSVHLPALRTSAVVRAFQPARDALEAANCGMPLPL